MDTLVSIRVFCQVAELKSFAAAADRLSMSPAMASKHVMQLEQRLSTRLLNRTSRRVGLTEAGQVYFDQVRQMLDTLEEVEAVVSKATVIPRGTLKVSAPVWFANPLFAGMLAAYRARYPDVVIDLDLSGRLVNLVDEGFDLALRVSAAPGDGLIARPLPQVLMQLVAAPSYLAAAGRPTTLADLEGHAMLKYALYPLRTITLSGPEGEVALAFKDVLISGNETLLHHAAVAGMGMAVLPRWLMADDLAAGRLETVLPEALTIKAPLMAVYPSRKYLSAKVRTFIDFIAADPLMKQASEGPAAAIDAMAAGARKGRKLGP
ncbi:transcriptional regulator [Bradyrhizobium sp. SSBR45G]|uniref:LysR family transcriptional regulator n=1 Tax=unclassified Bradyrhizobium TaxID=2631580 RepID=UPI002342B629|nr:MULTISPECIES: LysR family transcriptional regulator [unclassified Bradyrhizobium]GLH81011.1 transcriptional regulator [Bradyrhizobium sp. SSBR45G]GLH88294.1 transcriptional regulator [Bradyrhizobium sp. SSBR45R]